ncbi:MAG: class I SAM-dependent methyltransferase [Acidobacteriaceae bacterium]
MKTMKTMDSTPAIDLREYWQRIYSSHPEEELSWFEPFPSISLDMLLAPSLKSDRPVLDVGSGASRLPDVLLDRGFTQLSVLDIAEGALDITRVRLGSRASMVRWICADVTHWEPESIYSAWHDRAVFHFLTGESDRRAYIAAMEKALVPGGLAVIGTFSTLGPERCSGLPVQRYSAQSLSEELGEGFRWTATRKLEHMTPSGQMQHFQFSRFVRE